MSRHSSVPSYDQRITKIAHDQYRLSWVVDFHYAKSRLRHPRGFSRDTDYAGAVRFAKRWNLDAPPLPLVIPHL